MKNANDSYLLSVLMFALATLMPGLSYATTYFVAMTGNDSNPGTEILPFRSIKYGVSSLSAGDTLYVKSGTYNESILSWKTKIPNGTSWDNPVTIAANPGDTVTINPQASAAFFWVQDGQDKYLIIDGFVVDARNSAFHGFKFSQNSRHIRVQNTEIKNAKFTGILITICNGCQYPASEPHDTFHEFINVNSHHNGTDVHDHGIYIETSHNLIQGSEFYNNTGYGIHIYHGYLAGVTNSNIARTNTLHDNGTSGDFSCGLLLSSGDGNVAYNNVAYRNPAGFCTMYRVTNALLYNNISFGNNLYGIYVGQNSNQSKIYNNSSYRNGKYGIFVGEGSKNAVLQNNIAYGHTDGNINLQPGKETGTTISHNLTTDPKFINPDANDFHLKEESSAIDGGIVINTVKKDYDGQERPQGSAPDIGALEFLPGNEDSIPPKAPTNVVIH